MPARGRRSSKSKSSPAAAVVDLVTLHAALLAVESASSTEARLSASAEAIQRVGFARVAIAYTPVTGAVVALAGFPSDDETLARNAALRDEPPADGMTRHALGADPEEPLGTLWTEPAAAGDDPRIAVSVRQLGAMLARVRQAESTTLRASRLQRLQDASQLLGRTLDEGELLREIARQVVRLVGAEGVLIADPDLERGELRTLFRVVRGREMPRDVLPLAGGVVVDVARSGRSARAVATEVDNPLVAIGDGVIDDERGGALLAVPMRSGTRLIGVLVAWSGAPHRYGGDDEEVLANLGAQAAWALINARLYAESERERRQTEALSEVARAVSESLRLGEVLRLIMRHAVALLHAEGAAIALREAQYARVVAAVGSAGLTVGMNIPLEGTLTGQVMTTGLYNISNDVSLEPRAHRATQRVGSVRKVVNVPLITGRETLGILSVCNRPEDFSDGDARVLQRLADQVAVAIVNARLFEELASATQEWRIAFDAIPGGLVVLDEDGRVTRFNARALTLAGVTHGQTLLGQRFSDAVMHEPAPASEAPEVRALRDGVTARATVRSSARARVYDVEASPHPNGGAVVAFDDVTDLHALAERHRLVVETSVDAIVITDRQRRIAFANPAAVELFAREGELTGVSVDDVLAPGQAERVRDHEQMAFAGRPQRYETVIERPDGEQRLVSVSTAPMRDVDRVTGIVASMRDVTNERRTRDAVLLSEARYRHLFETATDLIYTLDPKGGITSANEASCRAVGLGAHEVLGQNIVQYLAPEDAAAARTHFAAALSGEARRYDCRLRRPSGEERLLSVTNSPIRQGRDVIGILGIARDVTEERARAVALARSEDRYTRLVEAASDAIFTLDEEGNFTSVNAALEVATARERTQLIGRHFTTMLEGSPDRDALWVVFAETLRGNRSRAEFRFLRPNGEVRTGSINSAPIAEGDRITGALAVVRDVSDEKVLLQQVLQQEKLAAIGQLVSGVAHELNNPLAGVMAFSQLLLATELTAEQQQAADTIQNEGRRAAKIVNNLLTFARQHPPERSPVNINQVLRDTIALRRYALQAGQVHVDMQLDDALPPTWADPTQLQQVFLNLLTNAEHAVMQNSGAKRLHVRTARAGAMLLVSIGDNGPGIPDEQRDRIFNPFFTTKPVGQGTGLGLSLTDGIVREHGGLVRVESVVGAGATFIVELPLVGPHLEAVAPEVQTPSLRRTVLVVSADTGITDRARFLEDDGHDVAVAPSGELGLRRAGERRWDVVLLDMRVPDMSPSRFYARLVAQAPRVAERVLFVSDPDAGGEAEWVRGTGRASLARPLTHEALLAALRSGTGH